MDSLRDMNLTLTLFFYDLRLLCENRFSHIDEDEAYTWSHVDWKRNRLARSIVQRFQILYKLKYFDLYIQLANHLIDTIESASLRSGYSYKWIDFDPLDYHSLEPTFSDGRKIQVIVPTVDHIRFVYTFLKHPQGVLDWSGDVQDPLYYYQE